MTILDEILAHKRDEVAAARQTVALEVLEEQARRSPPPRNFRESLAQPGIGVIAEIKQRSPSAGVLREMVNPAEIARRYQIFGARAISVVTDRRFFGGEPEFLPAVRAAVSIPVLRKDFLIDEYQVYESRALGADAVLLIVSALAGTALRKLIALTAALAMPALVEVHTEAEVDQALEADAELIGINNRDLATFQVDLGTTERLRPRIPRGVFVVSESGIETPGDVVRVCRAGADAILVGTALMAHRDPAAHLRALRLAAEQTGGMVS